MKALLKESGELLLPLSHGVAAERITSDDPRQEDLLRTADRETELRGTLEEDAILLAGLERCFQERQAHAS
jgi:hypothetical protein